MKLNIASPATGGQKIIEVEDEKKLRVFYGKRMGQEVDGNDLGDEFAGYIFKITGGNDKEGFPMMQGVLKNSRTRLLLKGNQKCYRERRDGARKRKSVRGCIVGADLSVLSLVVIQPGEKPIEGVTDVQLPKRLGPKRASNIRKLFNLDKEDDVRKYVVKRKVEKNGKTYVKSPKIQRLVTPRVLQHKRQRIAKKRQQQVKTKKEAAEYAKILQQRMKEAKERRASQISKRRSRQSRESQKKAEKA